jgi:hypothetical protein
MKKNIISCISILILTACSNNELNNKNEIEKRLTEFFFNQESIYNKTHDFLISYSLLDKIEGIRSITNKDVYNIKKSNHTTDKPIMLEGSVFTSLYDGFTKYKILDIEITGNTAQAVVNFVYNSKPQIKWTDTIILIKENKWKIENVKFDAKTSYYKDLNEKLDPINFNNNAFVDIRTNKNGERLKLVHYIKSDIYTITFKNKKATLMRSVSADGERYEGDNFELWFKGNNLYLRKDDNLVFSSIIQENIDLIEAKNYFLRNDYPEKSIHIIKINNKKELDRIFGTASTMGKDGQSTKIDFNKFYAVAIIGENNDLGNSIYVLGIIYEHKKLNLTLYTEPIDKEKKQSYFSRPFKIILIEKKYKGEIIWNNFC